MVQRLHDVLRGRLATSLYPVERDIAGLLGGAVALEAEAFRLQRYHRKIDVARKVMVAYDDAIDKPVSPVTLTSDGYLGLALVFVGAARRESFADDLSRANALRWVNSAFNCLERVDSGRDDAALADIEAELQALLLRASPV